MRRRTVVCAVLLLGLGIFLLGLSIVHLETLTQIGYREGAGAWKTLEVYLEKQQICRFEIVFNESEVGRSYRITISQVENGRMLMQEEGVLTGTVFPSGFQALETGYYKIDWNGLYVSRITAYGIGDLIPKDPVVIPGVFVLMAGIISFLGFEWKELFRGEKTQIFWRGLIIFGLAIFTLFSSLWWGFVLLFGVYYYPGSYVWPSRYVAPAIFGGTVFLLIGLYMMKSGVKKKAESKD